MGLLRRGADLIAGSRSVELASRKRDAVVVLAYHRIGEPTKTGDPQIWSATPEVFSRQLELIADRFELIAPSEVPAAVGKRGRYAAITFDDGYRDSSEIALPILREHGIRAAFFICTGFPETTTLPWWDEIAELARRKEAGRDPAMLTKQLLGRFKELRLDAVGPFMDSLRESAGVDPGTDHSGEERWMSWSMIRGLRDAGMEIGGHTINHPLLANAPEQTQRTEIEGCLGRIEKELGRPAQGFCYPVGTPSSFSETTRRLLAEAGVTCAFSCYGGAPSRRAWDRLDVPRIAIGNGISPRHFRALTLAPNLFASRN